MRAQPRPFSPRSSARPPDALTHSLPSLPPFSCSISQDSVLGLGQVKAGVRSRSPRTGRVGVAECCRTLRSHGDRACCELLPLAECQDARARPSVADGQKSPAKRKPTDQPVRRSAPCVPIQQSSAQKAAKGARLLLDSTVQGFGERSQPQVPHGPAGAKDDARIDVIEASPQSFRASPRITAITSCTSCTSTSCTNQQLNCTRSQRSASDSQAWAGIQTVSGAESGAGAWVAWVHGGNGGASACTRTDSTF